VYGEFTTPSGSEFVVIASDALIVIERSFVPLRPPLSTTRTVKFVVPAAVGIPLINPVPLVWVDIFNPAGNEPETTDHIFGTVPPVKSKVALYVALTTPCGNAFVTMVGGAMTLIARSLVALRPPLSATRTVKLDAPAVVGVPVISPFPFPCVDIFKPAGKDPADIDHVLPPEPPVTAIV
jgi:hypothetical protein